jgi:hypothetical protein
MVVRSADLRPLLVGASYVQQLKVLLGQIMADSALITIPVPAFCLVFQRAPLPA